MSLFKLREWWRFRPERPAECDAGCLCVANIDNQPLGAAQEKVLLGDFGGQLRIFRPRQKGFQVEDLMLECNLGAPIIQLAAGRFVSQSSSLALAVLHPARLVVFLVVAQGGTPGEPAFFEMKKQYEHKLPRPAFNLTYGPFGGVQGKDYICVQLLDGELLFYEHDQPSFSRRIDNCFVPGPLQYVAQLDALLTVDSNMHVQAYKYYALSTSVSGPFVSSKPAVPEDEEKPSDAIAPSGAAVKRLQAEWSTNIGEYAVSLSISTSWKASRGVQLEIVVLGERSLFVLGELGNIRTQRLLDVHPSCATLYGATADDGSAGESGSQMLVAAHEGAVLVYRNWDLVWMARMAEQAEQRAPVASAVLQVGELKGLVAFLFDDGEFSLFYLGTEPAVPKLVGDEAKEPDYESLEQEHRSLVQIIKASQAEEAHENEERFLDIQATVPGVSRVSAEELELAPEILAALAVEEGRVKAVVLNLVVACRRSSDVSSMCLNVTVPAGFVCDRTALSFSALSEAQRVTIFCARAVAPDSLWGEAFVACTLASGDTRVATTRFELPLELAMNAIAPVKNAQYMLTLDVAGAPPALSALFPEFLPQLEALDPELARAAGGVMSFAYADGADVTLLASKKGGRFRIQSGRFDTLGLAAAALVARLPRHVKSDAPAGFSEALPLADFFAAIDYHFEQRLRLASVRKQQAALAQQFRAIQKRLLARYRDKTPAPLLNLDQMLMDTHQLLLSTTQDYDAAVSELSAAAGRLASAVRLFTLLAKLKFQLSAQSQTVLEQCFAARVPESAEQGWEEATDAAITLLLRTSLAKSAKEAGATHQANTEFTSTAKLKRHIQIVCERLEQGASLA